MAENLWVFRQWTLYIRISCQSAYTPDTRKATRCRLGRFLSEASVAYGFNYMSKQLRFPIAFRDYHKSPRISEGIFGLHDFSDLGDLDLDLATELCGLADTVDDRLIVQDL